MSDLIVGGLTLCKNQNADFKWIRLGGTQPQGWEPVPQGTFDPRMPNFDKPKYEIEVDFD